MARAFAVRCPSCRPNWNSDTGVSFLMRCRIDRRMWVRRSRLHHLPSDVVITALLLRRLAIAFDDEARFADRFAIGEAMTPLLKRLAATRAERLALKLRQNILGESLAEVKLIGGAQGGGLDALGAVVLHYSSPQILSDIVTQRVTNRRKAIISI